jgi:mannose-1-phosphate guanylyltransferase/phosphomannomutase
VFSDTVNTGIFVLEPEIFDWIEPGVSVDFSSDVFPRLLDAGEPLYGAIAEGYWEDVGTLEAYVRAHQDVLDGKVELDLHGFEIRDGVYLGESSEIHPDARIQGPALIGDYCRIEAGATVGEYTVLGSNVMVRSDAYLQRSVVHDNAYIAEGVRTRGAVIGRSCDLRRGARAEEGVVLGEECFVGEHAVLNPSVKVYPFKTVEPGAIINSSIVWESRGARSLFVRGGVSGLANVDITPELAVRVAMAYATTLKKGSKVVTSRDSSRAARALKRAVMAGLNAAGVNVEDLEVAPVPTTRFQIRNARAQGGITTRLVPGDPQSVVLRFFDADGIDIDETTQRKIERLFHREDFRRAFAADIGDIDYPARALEFYSGALMATVDAHAIRNAGFKVVIDYAYGATSFTMPNLLSKLGADILTINPFASTSLAASFDPEAHTRRVAELVRASGAHLGVVLDPGGERLRLIDDAGRVLSNDEALYGLLTLVVSMSDSARVALPVAVSRQAERICKSAGAEIVWTKLSASSLMEAATSHDVVFAASQDAGYIFPRFLPAYDATAAFVNILELLARTGMQLSKVIDGLDRVHVVHETVVTPWEQKGTVMRTLVERVKDREVVMVDGVKVLHDEGWALVLPDPEEPITHVWAEGPTDGEARGLAQEYARRIRQMLR